jgi:predicted nucleotide-binding protein
MDAETSKSLIAGLIEEFQELKVNRNQVNLDAFRRKAKITVQQIFGPDSEHLRDLNSVQFTSPFYISNARPGVDIRSWNNGWNQLNNLLNSLLIAIDLSNLLPQIPLQPSTEKEHIEPTSNKVFIVHGHDEAMKQAVARTLEKLDLEPVILHEKPNKGRTIIEKFSDYSDVSFAVVLLSPDDIGYSKEEGPNKSKSRARQNVILELGYFLGATHRERVLVLFKDETNFEIPSDYTGVIFVAFDDPGRWQIDLIRELKACGFTIDANKLYQ